MRETDPDGTFLQSGHLVTTLNQAERLTFWTDRTKPTPDIPNLPDNHRFNLPKGSPGEEPEQLSDSGIQAEYKDPSTFAQANAPYLGPDA